MRLFCPLEIYLFLTVNGFTVLVEDILQKNNDGNKQQEGSDLADYDCKVEGCEEDMDDVGSIEEDTVSLEGGFKIPAKIFDNNFDYHKTRVKWLWELHR